MIFKYRIIYSKNTKDNKDLGDIDISDIRIKCLSSAGLFLHRQYTIQGICSGLRVLPFGKFLLSGTGDPGRFSSLLFRMDITCGITFSTDSSTMAQLECALLSSNLEDIEKYASKLKKKKEITASLEIVLECYVAIHRQIRLHAASLELDLTHLLAYQIKPEISNKIKEKLKKVIMMDSSGITEFELKLAYVLLGILGLFSSEGGKECLKDALAYFDKIDFDLSKKFLLYEQGDTEISQSTLIEKIFGILGLYFRGVALELYGNKEDACDQYQIITDFIFRFRVQQFTQAKSVYDFICASLHRSGCLLNQLGQFRESASVFRSFLNFYQVNPVSQAQKPVNSTIRLLKVLSQYMDLLDRNFRQFNFKTFCDEQASYSRSTTGTNILNIWQSENVQEEMILCCMLFESIEQKPLVKQFLADLRLEGSVLRRFARIGYLEGISRIQKSRFLTGVSDVNIYRNLFHSLMSAGKTEQAILSAKMYLQSHGKDPFTLLLIVKLYLNLPNKFGEVHEILDNLIDFDALDVGLQIPYFCLKGKLYLLKSRLECPFVPDRKLEYLKMAQCDFRTLLQIDEDNAEAHFYLSLISCEMDDLDSAERLIKKSLSLNSDQIKAWNLFALLKSTKKEYEAVLSICNTELSNMIQKDLNLSLLKISALLELNRSDEAIDSLKRIISAHFYNKSNDMKMDGGMTVISEGTLGPGNFLSKFLADLNYGMGSNSDLRSLTEESEGSLVNLDILMGIGKFTSFQEYTESFPQSLNEYLIGKAFPDCDGITGVIPLEDLKAIQKSNTTALLSLLWIEVAKVYLREGLLQDAEAAVNQAYLSNEVFSPTFGLFGLIEESRGNYQGSEEFYRKGLSIDSRDEICSLGLGRILIGLDRPFESEILMRNLLQKDSTIPEAWSILAQSCSKTGRHEEALKYFEIALKRESTNSLRSIRSITIQ